MTPRDRFTQIFWGLLLVILDIKINMLDLLPDFIGYILVALGCAGLAKFSSKFYGARTAAWLLVPLALVTPVIPSDINILFTAIYFTVDCSMVWFLLGGIIEISSIHRRPDLASRAANRRLAYIITMTVAMLTILCAQGSRDAATFMLVILVLFCVPLLILILNLIHRVKHEIAQYL